MFAMHFGILKKKEFLPMKNSNFSLSPEEFLSIWSKLDQIFLQNKTSETSVSRKADLLVSEFEEIFSDIFSRSTATHKEIISCLADGPKDLLQICKELKKHQGGRYSKHLDDLVKAGFVQRDFSWHLKSGK